MIEAQLLLIFINHWFSLCYLFFYVFRINGEYSLMFKLLYIIV